MADRLDRPKGVERGVFRRRSTNPDRAGVIVEGIARFLGTPRFLVYLTVFCLAWLAWNIWAPESMRFDSAANGFTALTLMLSLQASYAAPLILLAQNRQDDRDRVAAEQDRQQAARSLADTEYLAREVAALRQSLGETATRDFVRSELRSLLEELRAMDEDEADEHGDEPPRDEQRRPARRSR
ncbi:DUF1003 domain-containing protein [Demequina mangrovi]|uniref:DUF1003 domain-containing protein n=1 Tax=Demequina mangrovi TaxID=1043493 RepID=A0A1H6X3Q5_9MICO|nr:DUF1003 domain-containing protein [Demequina mangrovi]SEJ19215.1 Protein of unknown function [Demequina mangrovi]